MEGRIADVEGVALPDELSSILAKAPDELYECLDKITAAGGGVWLVGGAVRQGLLGKMPADWDLAVDLEPIEMLSIFPDALKNGIRYGTITIRIGEHQFEATTLRGEGHYGDGRRPDSVEFSKSLGSDLSRRDFTFNAMAVDVHRGLLHDPFEGRFDLKNLKLRAVGDAGHRIGEDGLRIMRAYRFLDLGGGLFCKPDHLLSRALVEQQYMIRNVAMERVWEEFRKILSGNSAGMILHRMAEDGILNEILPGKWDSHESSIISQKNPCLDGIQAEARLALLLHLTKVDDIEPGLKKLKLSKQQINSTLDYRIRLGTVPIREPEGVLRIYRSVLGSVLSSQLSIDRALAESNSDTANLEFNQFETRISELPKLKAGDESIVDGNWLMSITGLNQGRRLGRLKEWLHRIQVERDLAEISEIESVLCTLNWEYGDEFSWPRVCWP